MGLPHQNHSDTNKDHEYNLQADLLIQCHFVQVTNLINRLVDARFIDLGAKSQFCTDPDKVLEVH